MKNSVMLRKYGDKNSNFVISREHITAVEFIEGEEFAVIYVPNTSFYVERTDAEWLAGIVSEGWE